MTYSNSCNVSYTPAAMKIRGNIHVENLGGGGARIVCRTMAGTWEQIVYGANLDALISTLQACRDEYADAPTFAEVVS